MDVKMVILLLTVLTPYQMLSKSNDCQSGMNVRLRGSRSELMGRVEVCRNGEWQTMCAQRFNSTDATIVCRELGFSDKGARPVNTGFSPGSNKQAIWHEDATCRGTEETILDCPTQRLGGLQLQLCGHTNDVGVSCRTPTAGELRILGGPTTNAGRVEVFSGGQWGTVCDDYWSLKDAQVACRQLGFSATDAQSVRFGYTKRLNSDPAPILLDNLVCTGNEKRLIDCPHNGLGVNNCNHDEDAGLVCKENTFMDMVMTELKAAMQLKQERAENEIVEEERGNIQSAFSLSDKRNLWNELMKVLLDD